MDNNLAKILSGCIIFASVIAVVSLIVAIVGVSKNGSNEYYIAASGSSSNAGTVSTERIWMFQIGHYLSRKQYLDEDSGTIKGYDIDVVNAVCQLANQNCALVWDLYENCWNSQAGERPRGGPGLMGDWYDTCVGWVQSPERKRTYSFSSAFAKPPTLAIWSSSRRTFSSFPNLSGLKVGFLDGWISDEHCLDRYSDYINNFDSSDVTLVMHYQTEDDVRDALVSNEIDLAFIFVTQWSLESSDLKMLWQADENRCVSGGYGLMTRQNQFDLLTWWNSAFDRLMDTNQYEDICNRLETAHSDQPGEGVDFTCV